MVLFRPADDMVTTGKDHEIANPVGRQFQLADRAFGIVDLRHTGKVTYPRLDPIQRDSFRTIHHDG